MRKIFTSKFNMSIVLVLMVVIAFGMPITARSQSSVTKPGTFPLVTNKITLSIVSPMDTDPTLKLETNRFTKFLEEKTNIHIEWRLLNNTNFKEQMTLMFASGDLPDIVLTGPGGANTMTKVEESQFGAQGLLLPLNKLIDKQSVWFKEALKEQKDLEKFISNPDGNIYALPNIADELHTQFPAKMWINTTWLKNLGLKMPTTTEEFYQTLVAFRDKDPNKNGKKDEIPLSTSYRVGNGGDLDGFLMNAFTYAPLKNDNRLYIKKGKVTMSVTDPEYKEGLKYLAKLYREGLIYKDSFAQDQRTQINLNESDPEPKIGCYLGLLNGYACDVSANNVSFKWHQYNWLAPLKGPKGFRSATYRPYMKYITGMASITRGCKNPEAAFRMLDYFYSREALMNGYFGREGMEWKKAEPGATGLLGNPATWQLITINTKLPEYQNIKWGQMAPWNRSKQFQNEQYYPAEIYDKKIDPMVARQRLMYPASAEMIKYAPKADASLPPMAFTKEVVGEMSQLTTTINDYVNESLIKFITGNLDVEKDWGAFLAQLDKLGLKRWLQLYQENYNKNYK